MRNNAKSLWKGNKNKHVQYKDYLQSENEKKA